MAQLSNQAGLSTDAYPTARPATSSKTQLSTNQKKMLGISVATVLLGGAAGLAIANRGGNGGTTNGSESTSSEPAANPEASVSLPADIDVAGKVTDTMSFERAFQTAREEVGMGGAFNWHGRWYNTFEKEEWSGLSLEQRQEYTELIAGEKLPVKPYNPIRAAEPTSSGTAIEPTIIEGSLNGQRVMGLDFDQDGIIDTLVMEGEDGYTYRVVDATGDQGLDTLYMYDSLGGEVVLAAKIDSTVLSNDDFSQGLENAMSKEVVNSIIESDVATTQVASTDDVDNTPEDTAETTEGGDDQYEMDAPESDDTYINNGNVRDMDE